MINVKSDLTSRFGEVDLFISFLKTSEDLLDAGAPEAAAVGIGKDLIKVMKASAFLVLYNVVESTMRNSIQEIFDHLVNQKTPFDDVRTELKKIVLKNLKKPNVDKILGNIRVLAHDVIIAGFDPSELFSGNVDAAVIREIANSYGFSHATTYANTKNGEKLLTVKSQRNDLAHGVKSFGEVGKEKTVREIMEIRDEVKAFLVEIVDNIDAYLTSKSYLKS